jgi:hypothetical protein
VLPQLVLSVVIGHHCCQYITTTIVTVLLAVIGERGINKDKRTCMLSWSGLPGFGSYGVVSVWRNLPINSVPGHVYNGLTGGDAANIGEYIQ